MATYNPQDHTVSNKGYGTIAKPVDARSWWTDGIEERPFASTAEVLAYFPTADSRKGNFLIYIGSEAYTFNGTADADLTPFVTQDVDSAPVENSTKPIASGYFFGKEFGGGGLTYTNGKLYAGELEVKLNLEYFTGIWQAGTYQAGWLAISTDRTKLWKAKRTFDSQAEPVAGNDWELLLQVPGIDAQPVADSSNGIASGYVEQLVQKLAYVQNGQLQDASGNALSLSVPMDTQPVSGSVKPVQSKYFFDFHKTLPRYNQAAGVWTDWEGNTILQVVDEPLQGSPYPVASGYLYSQMRETAYYRNGRLQDFYGNDINVGAGAGDTIYYATPKVYGSVEQLEALPSSEKVLGASYKVWDGSRGYTYEYRQTGEGAQTTISTPVAAVRVASEVYEDGYMVSMSTTNGALYALLEGTYNEQGSVYLEVVSSDSGYVPAAGAEPKTLEQVVYASPNQPPVNGNRTVYSLPTTATVSTLTYRPGVFEFVDITSNVEFVDAVEEGNMKGVTSNAVYNHPIFEEWVNNVNYPPNYPRLLSVQLAGGTYLLFKRTSKPLAESPAFPGTGTYIHPVEEDTLRQYYAVFTPRSVQPFPAQGGAVADSTILYEGALVALQLNQTSYSSGMTLQAAINASPSGYVLLSGNGGGETAETAASIRDKLQTLTGTDRLDASAIQNLPTGGATVGTGALTPASGVLTIPMNQDGIYYAASYPTSITVDTTNNSLGRGVVCKIVANGTTAPTVAGATKHNSSANFNTANGTANTIRVWCEYNASNVKTNFYIWTQQ